MSQPGRKENKHGYLVLTRSSTNILKRHQVYKYTQVPMFTLYYFTVITLHISFFDNIHSYIIIQNWNTNVHSDTNYKFNDFYWRLEGCIARHALLKKLNKKQTLDQLFHS